MITRRNVSDDGDMFKVANVFQQRKSCHKNKQIWQKFQKYFAVQLCKYLKAKKLSARPNSFWELGSQVPPLFPALNNNIP